MKVSLKILLPGVLFFVNLTVFSQQPEAGKVHDVFITFITEKLSLTPREARQMRPLVIRYLRDIKKIQRENSDALVREQQKIALKIQYRKWFTSVIGSGRSNQFFIEEQLFRKRVREELKQRRDKKNVIKV